MPKPQTGPIAVDVAARHAHVLGDGPRIAALPDEGISAEARQLVDTVRNSAGAGTTAAIPEYMRLMLKHMGIFRVHMEMGTVLFNGLIPARERELAILRCGWLCRAPYEWGEHVGIGKRFGVTDAEVARAVEGSSAEGWSAHDRAIVRGVEELIADQALSDETWEILARTWDEAQMIEFPMMVGQYIATACVQNTLRVRLAPDNAGLSRR